MKEYERKQLLERINRDGATVGATIPEQITVGDEEVPLREFVFEIKRRETIPAGERERVEQAKRNLRRERQRRVTRLESGDIDFDSGEREAQAIIGIDRALNALEQLGPTDLETEADAQTAADQKRWVTFLKKALGHNEGTSGRFR